MRVLIRQQLQWPWLRLLCEKLREEGHQIVFAARSKLACVVE